MGKVWLILSLLLIATSSRAQQQANYCENLFSSACTPGVIDDGTGRSQTQLVSQTLQDEGRRMMPELSDRFYQLVTSVQGNAVREAVINGYSLRQNPSCANGVASESCSRLIADKLAVLHLRRSGFMSSLGSSVGNVADLNPIFENAQYVQLTEQYTRENEPPIPAQLETRLRTEIFPRVIQLLRERINSMSIRDETKQEMLRRIEAVQYRGLSCPHRNGSLAAAFVPNAIFEVNAVPPQFSFCKGYFRHNTSEFAIVASMAHEIAHSIDPCMLALESPNLDFSASRQQYDNSYLKENFVSCLRSERSVGAISVPLDPSGLSNEIPNFCERDQIVEGVADWFGTEVLASYSRNFFSHLSTEQRRNGFINSLRNSCSVVDHEMLTLTHPLTQNRYNGLLLAQPQIRQQLGCSQPHSRSRYCDINNPNSLSEISSGRSTLTPVATPQGSRVQQ